jgi:glutathione S-transferase
MRLFYTVGSPFARIVRIALLETGLDARVTKQEVIRQRLYSVESEVLAFNPVGRVPTFELDDGTILSESKLILDYIDALNPGPKLLPRDGSDRWRTLAEMGQASGLLEGIVTWLRALRSREPERVSAVIAWETARVNRAADVGGRGGQRSICRVNKCRTNRIRRGARLDRAEAPRLEVAREPLRFVCLV